MTHFEQAQLNWIANFIWGIADDVLCDLYARDKYRDVILPMTVLRRLDVVLEPTKQAVLDMKASLDQAGIVYQDKALRQTAGQAFYNTSKFMLRDLKALDSQQLKTDFETYLNSFSSNVQKFLKGFDFLYQIQHLSEADALCTLIAKFLSPDINLSPNPVLNGDGSVKHAGLETHAMLTIFDELVRRINVNNKEAGKHWPHRDAVIGTSICEYECPACHQIINLSDAICPKCNIGLPRQSGVPYSGFVPFVGFTRKREDGYFKIVIGNYEYEGYIKPDSFEYYDDKIINNKGQAIKELEEINGGKLHLVRTFEKSLNEKIVEAVSKHENW